MIKKQFLIFFICIIMSFFISCAYSIKQDLFLGIKSFFLPKTVIKPDKIFFANYKRDKDNDNKYIVSKISPFLLVYVDDEYIDSVQINFKETIKDNFKFNVYMEKENINELIKISNIESFLNKSYTLKIEDVFQKLVVALGEQKGDSFVLDNIIFFKNYRYYFDKILNYNNLKLFKLIFFWITFIKILVSLIILFELFFYYKCILKKRKK